MEENDKNIIDDKTKENDKKSKHIKNPNRVDAGKRLAARNKKEREEMEQYYKDREDDEERKMLEPSQSFDPTQLVLGLGIVVLIGYVIYNKNSVHQFINPPKPEFIIKPEPINPLPIKPSPIKLIKWGK